MSVDYRQKTIDFIQRELDLNVGILITVDRESCLTMSAASRNDEEAAKASELLSKLSQVLFSRYSLMNTKTANKHPI